MSPLGPGRWRSAESASRLSCSSCEPLIRTRTRPSGVFSINSTLVSRRTSTRRPRELGEALRYVGVLPPQQQLRAAEHGNGAPKAEKTWANSAEMYPPPMTITGAARQPHHRVGGVEVHRVSARSGITGRLPAASTNRSAVMVSAAPTSSSRGPTKRACASKTVTLSLRCRWPRPSAAMGSIRPKIRSRISRQRTPRRSDQPRACSPPPWRQQDRPGGRTSCSGTADVEAGPPNVPISTKATLSWSNRSSMMEFPDPVPMMQRSKCRTRHRASTPQRYCSVACRAPENGATIRRGWHKPRRQLSRHRRNRIATSRWPGAPAATRCAWYIRVMALVIIAGLSIGSRSSLLAIGLCLAASLGSFLLWINERHLRRGTQPRFGCRGPTSERDQNRWFAPADLGSYFEIPEAFVLIAIPSWIATDDPLWARLIMLAAATVFLITTSADLQ